MSRSQPRPSGRQPSTHDLRQRFERAADDCPLLDAVVIRRPAERRRHLAAMVADAAGQTPGLRDLEGATQAELVDRLAFEFPPGAPTADELRGHSCGRPWLCRMWHFGHTRMVMDGVLCYGHPEWSFYVTGIPRDHGATWRRAATLFEQAARLLPANSDDGSEPTTRWLIHLAEASADKLVQDCRPHPIFPDSLGMGWRAAAEDRWYAVRLANVLNLSAVAVTALSGERPEAQPGQGAYASGCFRVGQQDRSGFGPKQWSLLAALWPGGQTQSTEPRSVVDVWDAVYGRKSFSRETLRGLLKATNDTLAKKGFTDVEVAFTGRGADSVEIQGWRPRPRPETNGG